MRVSLLAAMLVALAAGTTLAGAQGLVPAGGLSIVSARVRGTDQLTGTVLGWQGAVALGRLELALSYVQGKIGPEGAGATGQDLVEGVALLGVRPAPWLRLAVGPHARSYTLTGGTQLRWGFWELRARASRAVVGSAGRGCGALRRAPAASAVPTQAVTVSPAPDTSNTSRAIVGMRPICLSLVTSTMPSAPSVRSRLSTPS